MGWLGLPGARRCWLARDATGLVGLPIGPSQRLNNAWAGHSTQALRRRAPGQLRHVSSDQATPLVSCSFWSHRILVLLFSSSPPLPQLSSAADLSRQASPGIGTDEPSCAVRNTIKLCLALFGTRWHCRRYRSVRPGKGLRWAACCCLSQLRVVPCGAIASSISTSFLRSFSFRTYSRRLFFGLAPVPLSARRAFGLA